MTDKEIVKEVTEAYNQNLDAGCYVGDLLGIINRTKEKEKHYRQKVQNQREIINAIQDKINRQKAEIEALQMDNQQLQSDIANANMNADHALAEIERLQAYHDDMESAIYQFREDHAKVKFFKGEIKAEAVKEFAERLKETATEIKENAFKGCYVISAANLNNLVKEMVGEQNDHNP